MGRLSNVSPSEVREFFALHGFKLSRTKGGHEMWTKSGVARALVLQTHLNPVSEMTLRSNLKTMGLSVNDFLEFLKK